MARQVRAGKLVIQLGEDTKRQRIHCRYCGCAVRSSVGNVCGKKRCGNRFVASL